MTSHSANALFQLRLPGGELRCARGPIETGPAELLPAALTIDALVAGGREKLLEASSSAALADGPVPPASAVVVPLGRQEVWAAGVTYLRSRDARMEEAIDAGDCYSRVYDADRPELFFKATAERVRAGGEPIGIRFDSEWDVPEPELGLVLSPAMEVVAYTIGNDVSSRSIEGENPLYLPQAKVYDGCCAVGPALVAADLVSHPFEIQLEIYRDGASCFADRTSTDQLRRTELELSEALGRCLTFPHGACLLTGTSLVPEAPFTLRPGDEVAIRISGLGELRNVVELVTGREPAVAA